MCGIAGVINTRHENRPIAKRIFKSIMLDNETRGKDSTGVLAIDRETKTFSLFKDTLKSSIFMNRKKFRQVEGDVFIGHCRLATHGAVNIRNAHPLQREDVFLVHNGVISNHTTIGTKFNLEHEVDSEVLIPIVKNEDWKTLTEIEGTANFIAWNKANDKIYVERHDNPLFALSLDEFGILVFSSKREALAMIADHYSTKTVPYSVADDTLYIITLGANGNVCEEVNLEFPKAKFLPAYGPYTSKDDYRYDPQYGTDADQYGWDDDGYGLVRSMKDNIDKKNKNRDIKPDDFKDPADPMNWREHVNTEDMLMDDDDIPEDEFCSACSCDISQDEIEMSMAEWGFGLCYNCNAELDEIHNQLQNGEKIDWSVEPYRKFVDVFKDNCADDDTVLEDMQLSEL